MALVSGILGLVTPSVRRHGLEYHALGKVTVEAADDHELAAIVEGSARYEVYVLREGETLHVDCECPHLNEHGLVCKHVWATLLAAEARGALQSSVASPPRAIRLLLESGARRGGSGAHGARGSRPAARVVSAPPGGGRRVSRVMGAEGFAPDRRKAAPNPPATFSAPRSPLAPRDVSASAPPKPAPPARASDAPTWRLALDLVTAERKPQAPVPHGYADLWREGRILYYVIDVPSSAGADGVAIDLLCRDLGKTGEHGKLKQISILHEAIPLLPDAEDRALLRLLAGAVRMDRRTRERHEYRAPLSGPLLLPQALLEPFLRSAARTGHLHVSLADGHVHPEPLAWSDGPPFRVRVDVRRETDGSFVVSACLAREGEERRLDELLVVSPHGIVVFPGTVARFADAASAPWLRALHPRGEIRVPASGAEDLAQALAARPGGLPADLPEELRLEEIRIAPRPRVVVSEPRKAIYWAPARLEVRPSFVYGDADVPAALVSPHGPGLTAGATSGEPSVDASFRVPGARKIVRRDLEAEGKALARLAALGVASRGVEGGAPSFEMSPRDLPRLVEELAREGWLVEADGKVHRSAGSFRLAVATGIDWFELHGEADFEGVVVEVPKLLAAIKRGERTVTLGDGTVGVLPDDWLSRYGLLADLGEGRGKHVRYRRGQAALLDALLASLGEVSCDATFERLRRELRGFERIEATEPAAAFKGELRTYQKEGLAWLQFLERFGLGGCLADDMGLGKTVQVLAHLASRESRGPALVVAPRSLVFHWREEAKRFAPGLAVLDHSSPDRRCEAGLLAKHDIVLTTYGTLRRDVLFLKDIEFDYAILDEAQTAKNASTDTAKAVRLLKARHRLALSGTPVENHLGELWSLFEFLNPGMLGASSVFKRATLETRDPDDDLRSLLRKALRPFLLRRTKEAVARDLPARQEETIWCDLPDRQRKLYEELRDHYRASLLGKLSADGLKQAKIQVLEALLRLRQAACHPGLLSAAHAALPSAKLDDLMPQLEEVIEGGHKALVFSQFTSFLALLKTRLDARSIAYEYLDGKTRDRAARVARFQGDPTCSLFLISLKAGGLGLNLTAADYVFLLDPWWNPAAEAQAIDRAHRIGQTRAVFAYRLIARGTIEERVVELQRTKKALADAILGADQGLVAGLTREDLELLLA